jgi:hypothetical protein
MQQRQLRNRAIASDKSAIASEKSAIAVEKSANASEKSAITSEKAAAAAAGATKEAARSRADQWAPLVIVLPGQPEWPPRISRSKHSMPGANDTRLLDTPSQEVPEPFHFPQDEDTFLWFTMRGVVQNHGLTPARVRLTGEARFMTATSPLANTLLVLEAPEQIGWEGVPEHVLHPGQEAVFVWAYGHTLKEWRDDATMSITIMSTASTSEGVVDYLFLAGGGRPLEPVAGQAETFQLSRPSEAAITAYPTKRWYPWEGEPLPPPPS